MEIMAYRAILTLLAILLCGCSEDITKSPLHPSRVELLDHGFYLYVVPQHIKDKHGWQEDNYLLSWDRHCKGIAYSEQYNPLWTHYTSPTTGLTIRNDPWNIEWDREKPTQIIESDSPFIIDGKIEVYIQSMSEGTYFRFEDTFGSTIYIGSTMNLSDTLEIFSQLQYIAPDPNTTPRPWDCSVQN